MVIKEEVDRFKDEVIGLWREFHKIPELGQKEYKTSQKIYHYLSEWGIETKMIGKTGVLGILKGQNSGPTLMLRADIDALPIEEKTDLPYKSTHEGRMHACGHDTHMAMLLVAAKILSQHQSEIKGNIKFLFQPDEENFGARDMIKEGVLENPRVDAAMALHIMTQLQTGKIGISSGPVMGGGASFKVTVKGHGGHTADPHLSIDPIITSASIIKDVQIIVTREADPLKPPSIVFGRIEGGVAPNVIPEQVFMEGTIRWLDEDETTWPALSNRFEEIVKFVCKAHNADYEIEFPFCCHSVVNNPDISAVVESVANKVVNKKEDVVSYTTLIGDDFSEYGMYIPICQFFLGTANPEKGAIYPHHHPHFIIDEDSLPIGVEMHVQNTLSFFENWENSNIIPIVCS